MKNYVLKILSFFLATLIVILLLVNCIMYAAFDIDFYIDEYRKHDIIKDSGLNERDLIYSTIVLLDYLNDKRNDIIYEAEVFGNIQEVFNDREELHMVDVKVLFLKVKSLMKPIMLICIGLLLLVLVMDAPKILFNISRAWIMVLYSFLVIGTIFFIIVFIDFNIFWTGFHMIFFSNDLWLLDPATDVMIRMFPEVFFYDIVKKIVASFCVFYFIITGFSVYIYTKGKRNKNRIHF